MLNSIDTYTQAAKGAAEAMNKKDISLYDFHRRWFNQAKRLETSDDRGIAEAAWESAYADARIVPNRQVLA